MIRPLLCLAALALAVSTVSQVIAASPRYAITQLRPIAVAAGTYANVFDINDSGLVVGDETRPNASSPFTPIASATRALSWTPGAASATLLATPAGRVGATASRVNNAGQVVGQAYSSTNAVALTFLSATTSTLVNSTTAASASGINSSGDVVGYGSDGGFVLRNGVTTLLNAGNYSWNLGVNPTSINDAGLIVGQPRITSSSQRALRLSTTAAPVEIVSTNAGANVINNVGVVGGFVQISVGGTVTSQPPAIFANGVTTQLPLAPRPGDSRALGGSVFDLNDRSDGIGTTGPMTGSQAEQTPFLYRDGQMLNLTTLINGTLPAGFRPQAINNRGQIIGDAYVDHDADASTPRIAQSYRLDPIRVAGDANADGVVDVADLGILATYYGSSGRVFYETGDFNYDWKVDVADLGVLASNYGRPATLAADLALFGFSDVPEPATLATLSLAGLLLRRRRSL